jgi:hypothetical protein
MFLIFTVQIVIYFVIKKPKKQGMYLKKGRLREIELKPAFVRDNTKFLANQIVPMKIVKVEETKPFQNAHMVDARKIYETANTEVIHMNLAPEGIAKETHHASRCFFLYS